jgi:DNA-directed RNA polymerase specialized sigma24 family protein
VRARTSSTVSLKLPAAAVEPVDERESVLALLFAENHTALVRLATLLGAGSEAEDMVSEAFYRVFRHWERDQGPEAVLPYLRATVCNLTRTQA